MESTATKVVMGATQIGGGIIAQQAVERVGEAAVDQFLKSHQEGVMGNRRLPLVSFALVESENPEKTSEETSSFIKGVNT